MNPVYLNDFVAKLVNSLQLDKEILIDNVHLGVSIKTPKENTSVQWALAGVTHAYDALITTLNNLDKELEKVNASKQI